MAIFKCKMCGGALEVTPESSVIKCEYCGINQTLPRLTDEKRANYYDRADHYRRANDYDKALSVYEQILAEDNTDAEAYWSIVLCRYGIEYVKDPVTQKHVPTINRTQSASILADPDYQSALRYADGYQRDVYTEQANAIHEIQKGILAISQREEPFDVFICYKESDSAGQRTPDSVLAQELYYELTEMGYRVFFSRITLEDKLGSAYEPYIFAALQSAKVMVVLGTRAEYFEAVWVRNEWSRFLSLIRSGESKILIPAYRDMDPYDLPREFSHLQAQDMSKLGFMQDLVRGIGKLVPKNVDHYFHTESAPSRAPSLDAHMIPNYLKRISMFVADGCFDDANEYCDKVLDLEPENADAHFYGLLACPKVQCKKPQELAFLDFDFTALPQYKRAYHYADKERRAQLDTYAKPVLERLSEQQATAVKSERIARVAKQLQNRRSEINRLLQDNERDLNNQRKALQALQSPSITAASLQSRTKEKNYKTFAIMNLCSVGAFWLGALMFAVGAYFIGLLFLLGCVLGTLYSYMELSRYYCPQYSTNFRLAFYLITFNIAGIIMAIKALQGKTHQYTIGAPKQPAAQQNDRAARNAELTAKIRALEATQQTLQQELAKWPRSAIDLSADELELLEHSLRSAEARSTYRLILVSCKDHIMLARTLGELTNITPDNAMRLTHNMPCNTGLVLPGAQARELQQRLAAYGRIDLRLATIG